MSLFAQKINYLVSRDSPLLRIKQAKITAASKDIFGIDYHTLRRWVRDEGRPDHDMLKCFVESVNSSFGTSMLEAWFNDAVDMQSFIEHLGFNVRNESINPSPLHNRFMFSDFYMTSNIAERLFQRVSGLYLLYRAELSELTKGVAGQATLYVSHLEEDTRGFCIICYLCVPSFRGSGYFQYEGCVCQVEATLYWVFNEKSSLYPDYIFLITDNGYYTIDDTRFISGLYCTMNQDRPPKPVARPVVMKRVDDVVSRDELQNRLVNECKLLATWEDVPEDIKDSIQETE